MSTQTYINIQATITGELHYNYADEVNLLDIVKRNLELLCEKYGLELNWEEIY